MTTRWEWGKGVASRWGIIKVVQAIHCFVILCTLMAAALVRLRLSIIINNPIHFDENDSQLPQAEFDPLLPMSDTEAEQDEAAE